MDHPKLTHEYLVETGRGVVQAAPQLLIDADAEFDGPAGHGSLLAIGAISPYGETFYAELQPDSDDFVPRQREFCEEHGLQRERLLKEGLPATEAIRQFGAWTINLAKKYDKPAKFSAFNPTSDFGHIDLRFAKAGIANPYGSAPFDLKSWFMGLSGEWDWSATHKKKLPKLLLPERDFSHNALEDSVYQQEIHFAAAGVAKLFRLRRV